MYNDLCEFDGCDKEVEQTVTGGWYCRHHGDLVMQSEQDELYSSQDDSDEYVRWDLN